ncbi:MAG: hypothetical protein COT84_07315 [Chlamydiae bacterium CG10_big_fil_rev_8_21_14_0_10_35_9]|nr:MAG: hypothetical protein COT84_07315 [Chlamydiae bacterium CG10_big_fil_rev_8_21_14_0_10_35_9]
MTIIPSTTLAIPLDLWGNIMSFLPPQQQLTDRRVCQAWLQVSKTNLYKISLMRSISSLKFQERCTFFRQNKLIKDLFNQEFNKTLNFGPITREFVLSRIECKVFDKTTDKGFKYLQTFSPGQRRRIECLTFESSYVDQFEDRKLVKVFKLCPNLKSLTLVKSHITGRGFSRIPAENKLEKLTLDHRNMSLEEAAFGEVFKKAPNLKEFYLYHANITGRCLRKVPEENKLEKLILFHCERLQEAFLTTFFQKTFHLKVIDLSRTPTTGVGLSLIPLKCEVEILILRSCENLDEVALEEVCKKLPDLKEIHLSHTDITGWCLTKFPENNKVEILVLTNCKNLNENALGEVFKKLPNLKEIYLSHTEITGGCLTQFPKNNKLKKLFLAHCENLKENFLADLFFKSDLEVVNLSSTNITGRSLTRFPAKTNLFELVLDHCEKLDERFLADLFFKAVGLRVISLSYTNITGLSLMQIPKKHWMPTLNLRNCNNLNRRFLLKFPKEILNL